MIYQDTKQVILYGAGREARYAILLCKQKGLVPVCLCDRNQKKWGKTICGGVSCVSVEEAFSKYRDAKIMVTPQYPLRFHIMDELIASGIERNRIINYEPYKRVKSCRELQEYIYLSFTGEVRLCCRRKTSEGYPYVMFEGNMDNAISAVEKLQAQIKEKLNSNQDQETPCYGCEKIQDDYWPEDMRFRHVTYSAGGGCQFDCVYCFSPARHTMIETTWEKHASVKHFVESLERKNLIHPEAVLEIAPGEISILPDREEIFEILKRYRALILTNAAVYSLDIEQMIEEYRAFLVVSLDAGTRETFKKVKGVDMFDSVISNLKRYATHGAIIDLKYIFVEGLNDNREDVEGFVKLAVEVGAQGIEVSYDFQNEEALITSQTMVPMMKYMVETAEATGKLEVDTVFKASENIFKVLDKAGLHYAK